MMKKRFVSIVLTACLALALLPATALAVEENYETFDYRAYANMYPDVKAAYGYNAEKLYAHYVNYGKAEGRVGRCISGSNPKTNAATHAYGADPGAAGQKPAATVGGFSDVPAGASYAKAVDWAAETGLSKGIGENKSAPDEICSRGQIVSFLHRVFAK